MNKFIKSILITVLTIILFTGCNNSNQAKNQKTDYIIGIVQFAEHPSLDNCREGFIEGIGQNEFGYSLKFDVQNAQSDISTLNSITQKFALNKIDLICAIATPAAQAAYTAVQDTNIPVVMTAVSSPVEAGLAESFDKPNKGITGTCDIIPAETQLAMIRSILPEAKTIGILYSTGEINSEVQIKMYQDIASDYGFTIEATGVSNQSEIPMALDTLLTKVDCLNNLTDNTVVAALTTVLDKANEKKIPVFGSEEEQVKNGCVASQGINYIDLGIQTGKIAARILNGTAPEAIPIEVIEEYKLVVNKNALQSLGLTLSDDLNAKAEFVE